MKSIIKEDEKGVCFICGRYGPTEVHHIFNAANRKLSEKYGLKVHLCHDCHNEPPYGVHFNRRSEKWLKAEGQKEAMRYYGWSVEEFIEIFGRNYL